jgi:probable FeS assembly SUF system protein SufT
MAYVKLGQVPTKDRSEAAEVKYRANQQLRERELITLQRDCEAIQIPSGEKMTLPAGTQVQITQSLGGSYTVTTNIGYMVRIAGKDADALGLAPAGEQASASSTGGEEDTEKLVWEQLKTCFDPEIPVNIVDLGLVYECAVTPLSGGGTKATVKFTLTAPGCGMGDILRRDIEAKLLGIVGVKEAEVEVVLDPPWDMSRMSDEAKLQLGLL